MAMDKRDLDRLSGKMTGFDICTRVAYVTISVQSIEPRPRLIIQYPVDTSSLPMLLERRAFCAVGVSKHNRLANDSDEDFHNCA